MLNNANKMGRNSIVGARSVVTEGKEFPENSLIVDSLAKAVRTLDEMQIATFQALAQHYVENAKHHATRMKKIG